jgi:hypothetical protein
MTTQKTHAIPAMKFDQLHLNTPALLRSEIARRLSGRISTTPGPILEKGLSERDRARYGWTTYVSKGRA